MKQCPKCGGSASEDARFCQYCAFDFLHPAQPASKTVTEIAQHRICVSCGAIVGSKAKFCNGCAAPISQVDRNQPRTASVPNNDSIVRSERANQITYYPLKTLSQATPEQFPFMAVILGFLVSVGLGLALFVAGNLIYIYILYNSLIGMGIGATIGYGLSLSKYTNARVSFILVAICSLIPYLTYNIVLMNNQFPEATIGLIDFLKFRAQNEPFIKGMEIGAIGHYIVWIVEYAITLYYAWDRVEEEL